MNELRYTFLTDGISDQALIPILTWTLRQQGVRIAIQPEWADLRRLPQAKRTLADRIALSIEYYPCDLLFVHRDAERESRQVRITEIHKAIANLSAPVPVPIICVVPVRMQEAWLLFDETAIRVAAGNPNGKAPLDLPPVANLENLPDPKDILHDLLRQASGLSGRRLKKFVASKEARRVTDFIDDFSLLRRLPAFNAFEDEVRAVLVEQKWHLHSPPE